MLTLAALSRIALADPAARVRAQAGVGAPADAGSDAVGSDVTDALAEDDTGDIALPPGGDPVVGDTEPDSWLGGLPSADSWLAEDDVADLIGVAFAPDEVDALMQRPAGPLGRIDLSITYRRRTDLLRAAADTSRSVDELWLVATWSP